MELYRILVYKDSLFVGSYLVIAYCNNDAICKVKNKLGDNFEFKIDEDTVIMEDI